MPRLDLTGAGAVVTGASSGIGAATAVALARRGARVVALARRADRLAEVVVTCRAAGGTAVAVASDVAADDVVDRIRAAADGPVDVLVNNAGVPLHKAVLESSYPEVERVFAVDLLAAVRLSMAFLPEMVERRRGAIVNVTSVAAYVPNPWEAAYGAAKAALSRWSHGLAVEVAGSGVHVAVVSPGPIDTEIWGHAQNYFQGRKYPPSVVADAVVRAVERGRTHRTAPRRYGLPGALYPLLGAPMRAGVRRVATRYAGQSGDPAGREG